MGLLIIDVESLFEFVTEVCCKQCGDTNFALEDNEHERKVMFPISVRDVGCHALAKPLCAVNSTSSPANEYGATNIP